MMRNELIPINGDGETTRDFCYGANVMLANLLGAAVQKPEVINEIYVAVCARTSRNQLFGLRRGKLLPEYPHLKDCSPVYGDFRSSDVRHSEADILKAERFLGNKPFHTVRQGLSEVLDWYRQHR